MVVGFQQARCSADGFFSAVTREETKRRVHRDDAVGLIGYAYSSLNTHLWPILS